MTPWLWALWLVVHPAGASDAETLEAFVSLMEQQAGGALSRQELYAGALAGVADALNEHHGQETTAVLTRAEWQAALAWQEGERSGVGMEYVLRPQHGLLITDVYPGGPGDLAGLSPGDLVVGMDGIPFLGLDETHIHQIVRDRSTQPAVALEVRSASGLQRFRVERARYRVATLRSRAHGRHPYLRLPFFGKGAAKDLADALEPIPSTGILLDLRDNAGGLLGEALAAADLFLPVGAEIVQRATADGQVSVDRASRPQHHKGSVVVLVNRGTRGPAEALAAALRDHGVARLVGTPSGGNDTHPQFRALGDLLVAQTVGAWLRSPAGRSWGGEGLQPDLVVEPLVQMGPTQGPIPDLQLEAAAQLLLSQVPADD